MNLFVYFAIGITISWTTEIVAKAFYIFFTRIAIVLYRLVVAPELQSFVFAIVAHCMFAYVSYKWDTLWYYFPIQSPIVTKNYPNWRVVAMLKKRKKYESKRFYDVLLCDFDPIDDPLYPHVSLIYIVEFRERNPFWHTLTIWRVSTLSGDRMHVCDFHHFDVPVVPGVGYKNFIVYAFQSRGAIFIQLQHAENDEPSWLASSYVYDIRFDTKAKFEINTSPSDFCAPRQPLAILCTGRIRDQESIGGWRIRMVGVSPTVYEMEDSWIVMNTVADFRIGNAPTMINYEDMIFSRNFPRLRFTRGSGGKFACYFIGLFRVIVYDAPKNSFSLYEDLHAFVESDPILREIKTNRYLPEAEYLFNPMVINDRECIRVWKEKIIVRTFFGVPTLRLIAARKIFEANSTTLRKMKTEEFRRLTGVNLVGHFL